MKLQATSENAEKGIFFFEDTEKIEEVNRRDSGNLIFLAIWIWIIFGN